MQALVDIVRQGKALYIGISKYPPMQARIAMNYLKDRDVPCLIFQDKYSMFNRKPEEEILDITAGRDRDSSLFSPLAQACAYQQVSQWHSASSRAAEPDGFLREEHGYRAHLRRKVKKLQYPMPRRGPRQCRDGIAWAAER